MAISDYCTSTDIKNTLEGSWTSDTSYDALLGVCATRASRAIDLFTKRKPGAYCVTTAVARYFDGDGSNKLWIGELAAAPTKIEVAETGVTDDSSNTGGTYTLWAASDYLLWPYNALDDARPFLRLDIAENGNKTCWYAFPRGIRVTGKFGYAAATPDDIKLAAITQASRYFKRAQQAYADAGAMPELGQMKYLQDLDPDMALIVQHYVRMVV